MAVNTVAKLISLNDVLHMVKHVEGVEIQTTLHLSVIQETSVLALVQRESLDQRLCIQ